MAFVVQAHIDDHTLSATTETAKEAFGKAVEWQVVHRLTCVTISDGVRSFSITDFASAMAYLQIANRSVHVRPGAQSPEMMKPYPTYRQREVLQFLMQGDWDPILRLTPVGDARESSASRLDRAEPDLNTGDLYRIRGGADSVQDACASQVRANAVTSRSILRPWR